MYFHVSLSLVAVPTGSILVKFRATAQGDSPFNLVPLPSHMVPSPLYPSLQVQV